MEDKVRKFYDTVSQDYEMPDYDTFLANMQDSAKAQKFYNVVSQDYDMPEFNEFYGLFKKKVLLKTLLQKSLHYSRIVRKLLLRRKIG